MPLPPGPTKVTSHVATAQERGQGGELLLATDEETGRCRQPASIRCARVRRGQLRVVTQDGCLEVLQLGAGIHSQLLEQQGPHGSVGLQGVGLPSAPVERGDPQRVQPFAQRVRGGQGVQLGKDRGLTAGVQVGLQPVLEHRQPLLLEGSHLRRDDRAGHQVGEGGTTPQVESLLEHRRSRKGVPGVQ